MIQLYIWPNLSSLSPPHTQCVICGAEPIRTEVMTDFFAFFGKSGFDPKALMPAYGLAEFTLCATSQPSGRPLNILYVDQVSMDSSW